MTVATAICLRISGSDVPKSWRRSKFAESR
jgi:hypothetical protein